eukprot:763456-Pyramimonas_sp.AAC.2
MRPCEQSSSARMRVAKPILWRLALAKKGSKSSLGMHTPSCPSLRIKKRVRRTTGIYRGCARPSGDHGGRGRSIDHVMTIVHLELTFLYI